MAKHTLGPWNFGAQTEKNYWEDGNFYELKDSKGHAFLQVQLKDKTQESFANIRLIIAAPDMLEALQDLIESFHESVIANPDDFPVLKRAMEAVNKATKEVS